MLPRIPELLRSDVLAAKNSLDAADKAIANKAVTEETGKLARAIALSQYATALRRFSRLVLHGEVPPDLR
jgi:hypothetical protein